VILANVANSHLSSLMNHPATRYNNTAIVFHWLTAALIIGMLGVGKYMTSLDEDSALRFSLTQWHKSFGLIILVLSIARVAWRLGHRPPALPATMRVWERMVAGLSHLLFYLLILFMPISGWLMVSASPLNISTFFFNIVKVPHLPWLSTAANRAELADNFQLAHEYASMVLIVLLLLHISAALRHQFMLRDQLMTRMTPDLADGRFMDGFRLIAGFCFVVIAGGWLFVTAAKYDTDNTVTAGSPEATAKTGTAGEDIDIEKALQNWQDAEVEYTLILTGEVTGSFSVARAVAVFDLDAPENSTLNAIVETDSGMTGRPQVDDSLPGPSWFASTQFPEATFTSTGFKSSEPSSWMVQGDLKIRDVERSIEFPMEIDQNTNTASGGFTINRLDFEIGASEQPGDSQAGFNVIIDFAISFTSF